MNNKKKQWMQVRKAAEEIGWTIHPSEKVLCDFVLKNPFDGSQIAKLSEIETETFYYAVKEFRFGEGYDYRKIYNILDLFDSTISSIENSSKLSQLEKVIFLERTKERMEKIEKNFGIKKMRAYAWSK